MITTAGFALLLTAACWFDVLKLRIPNLIPMALAALLLLEITLGGVDAPMDHVWSMTLALAILMPLFALDMLGGGDVKLLAAVALWLGIGDLAALLILVGFLGGVFALLWLGLRRLLRAGLKCRRLPESLRAGAPLPFALPITAATLLLCQVR